jgi:hypothetical protein
MDLVLKLGGASVSKKYWEMVVLCAGAAGAIACGAAPESSDAGVGDGGGGASGTDAVDASHDSGLGNDWPDSGTIVIPVQPDPEEPKPGECGASSFEAQQISVQREVLVESEVTTTKPVALYIMFDQSQSMAMSNLWDPAVNAMKSFLMDEKSQGVGVGIQYFPLSNGSCNGGTYKTPAVDIALLPGHATKIAKSLDDHDPVDWMLGTPMEGALRGVTDFCKQYQASHADEQCVAVLVTDGKPQNFSGPSCNTNSATLTGIAKSAHDAGVTTFAVGLQGADFTLLDAIAQQGGAPDCDPSSTAYACNVSSGASKLADALTSIRDTVVKTETHTVVETHVETTALPCEWAIPAQPDGRVFDPDKVNIRWKTASAETTFVRVDSEAQCRANGWRFDNAENPTRLIACPQACDAIKAEPNAKLDVLLGCATLTPQ